MKNWKDVERRYWDKYYLLSKKFNDGGYFDTLAKQEKKRLQAAAEFLLNQNIITYEIWFDLDDEIIKRYKWIDQYYRRPLFEEKDRIMEDKKEKFQKTIDTKTNDMKKKYDF
ncbi:hypothetical protein [Shimazuella kribbensis]|uniref:hypothetical protein n=1 Tax=Shimazuella kribbensis TaxID=139808 RepID=UPI00048B440C|nr:hypothetical protein [Shimazuella kribbensis]